MTWTVGHCHGGHFYKWVSCPISALVSPGCLLFVSHWEVPVGLVAELVWPLSAAGEPFLRAEIVSQPSSHCTGKIPFLLVMQLHSGFPKFSLVEPKIWNHSMKRKWRITSEIYQMCWISSGEDLGVLGE